MSLEKTGIQGAAGRLASERSDTISTITGDKKQGGSMNADTFAGLSAKLCKFNPDGF